MQYHVSNTTDDDSTHFNDIIHQISTNNPKSATLFFGRPENVIRVVGGLKKLVDIPKSPILVHDFF